MHTYAATARIDEYVQPQWLGLVLFVILAFGGPVAVV